MNVTNALFEKKRGFGRLLTSGGANVQLNTSQSGGFHNLLFENLLRGL